MKRLAWLVAVAVLTGSTAADAYPARPEGPVLDLADVLPAADEAALNYRLTRYHETSGNTIEVVTVNSLEGQTIEDYGSGLFMEWRIGDPRTQRGILVLLAPSEGQAWIGIGCGFGNALTNSFGQEVMQTKMIPEYKQRRFEEGTLAAIDALIDRLATVPAKDLGPVSADCRVRSGAR
jgi:uncharacterized protein